MDSLVLATPEDATNFAGLIDGYCLIEAGRNVLSTRGGVPPPALPRNPSTQLSSAASAGGPPSMPPRPPPGAPPGAPVAQLAPASSSASVLQVTANVPLYASFGTISRNQAEDILTGSGLLDGTFLLRQSSNPPDDFGLSVVYKRAISHYKITKFPSGKYGIQDGLRFKTLAEASAGFALVPTFILTPHIRSLLLLFTCSSLRITWRR
jgi:hypothetical protein